ncbi:MAG: Gfo/Idh/MocA family protein [Planctomycetota bacterium]
MLDKTETTRRDLLARTAKAAAAAGLVSGVSCSSVRRRDLAVVAGPAPKKVKADQVIGVGLVGVGGRGENLYNAVMGQEGVMIKAIADPDIHHRKKALHLIKKKRSWEPEVYTGHEDYKTLMGREDIDTVVIATPPNLHAIMYLECFAQGKHFYGEKPMCIEVDEADALVAGQKKNPQVVGQIGFQRRASELYGGGIQKIREGLIGSILGARVAWNNSWGPLGLKKDGTRIWYGRRKMSGDWMLEQACHSWDVVNWVTGKLPIAASGIGRDDIFTHLDSERDVTDYYYAHLEYPEKFMVDFEHCWCCPEQKLDKERRFNGVYERFIGPKGGMDLSDGTFCPRSPKGEVFKLPGEQHNLAMTRKAIGKFFETVRAGGKSIADMEVGRMASLTGILVRKAVYEKQRVLMSELV